MEKAYRKSRYDKGEAAYINCPMTEDQFNTWYNEVVTAKAVQVKDFEFKVLELEQNRIQRVQVSIHYPS